MSKNPILRIYAVSDHVGLSIRNARIIEPDGDGVLEASITFTLEEASGLHDDIRKAIETAIEMGS